MAGITAGVGDAKAMLATRQIMHVAVLCSVREAFPLSLFFLIGAFEAPCVSMAEKAPRLALCQTGNRTIPMANRSKRKLPVKIGVCFTSIRISPKPAFSRFCFSRPVPQDFTVMHLMP